MLDGPMMAWGSLITSISEISEEKDLVLALLTWQWSLLLTVLHKYCMAIIATEKDLTFTYVWNKDVQICDYFHHTWCSCLCICYWRHADRAKRAWIVCFSFSQHIWSSYKCQLSCTKWIIIQISIIFYHWKIDRAPTWDKVVMTSGQNLGQKGNLQKRLRWTKRIWSRICINFAKNSCMVAKGQPIKVAEAVNCKAYGISYEGRSEVWIIRKDIN
jgi:hypothetical protein